MSKIDLSISLDADSKAHMLALAAFAQSLALVSPQKQRAKKSEAPKVEAPKVEAPKVEAPKVEAPKVEAPKVEAPKVEAPKVEAPKVEAPKVEAPKVEPAKTGESNNVPTLIELRAIGAEKAKKNEANKGKIRGWLEKKGYDKGTPALIKAGKAEEIIEFKTFLEFL